MSLFDDGSNPWRSNPWRVQSEPEDQPEPQPQESPETGPQDETGVDPQPRDETGVEPQAETGVEPDDGPRDETGVEPQAENETGVESQAETPVEPADGPQAETGVEPQPQDETGAQQDGGTRPQPEPHEERRARKPQLTVRIITDALDARQKLDGPGVRDTLRMIGVRDTDEDMTLLAMTGVNGSPKTDARTIRRILHNARLLDDNPDMSPVLDALGVKAERPARVHALMTGRPRPLARALSDALDEQNIALRTIGLVAAGEKDPRLLTQAVDAIGRLDPQATELAGRPGKGDLQAAAWIAGIIGQADRIGVVRQLAQ